MKPVISIITAVYNGAPYIREAIDSVIHQTFRRWELIIVNDGSTDDTAKIVATYSDPRIIYREQENRGVSAARNVALGIMRGDFFCFLDADDRLSDNSLAARLTLFDDREVEFVDGVIEVMNSDFSKPLDRRIQEFEGNPLEALLNLNEKVFFGPTWMIRRTTEKSYRFQTGLTHGEDLLFYISIAHSGVYKATKKTIYYYRSGNSSAMANLDALWEGYKIIIRSLVGNKFVSRDALVRFRNKVTIVMFKSYLSNWELYKSLSVLLTLLESPKKY